MSESGVKPEKYEKVLEIFVKSLLDMFFHNLESFFSSLEGLGLGISLK